MTGVLSLAACVMTKLPPPEQLRRSKCGACHIAPAAASQDRQELEAALAKHKGRVPLSAHDKEMLVNHLVKSK